MVDCVNFDSLAGAVHFVISVCYSAAIATVSVLVFIAAAVAIDEDSSEPAQYAAPVPRFSPRCAELRRLSLHLCRRHAHQVARDVYVVVTAVPERIAQL
jgi:hypothetical protein